MFALSRLEALWRRWRRPPSLGARGEREAERFLKRLGYKIVARGERHFGEIDLVAVDGRTVVFVEVKTRHSHAAGAPESAVDADKQRRLVRAATAFLKRHGLLDNATRFDVVAVTWPADQKKPHIEHFINAFRAA